MVTAIADAQPFVPKVSRERQTVGGPNGCKILDFFEQTLWTPTVCPKIECNKPKTSRIQNGWARAGPKIEGNNRPKKRKEKRASIRKGKKKANLEIDGVEPSEEKKETELGKRQKKGKSQKGRRSRKEEKHENVKKSVNGKRKKRRKSRKSRKDENKENESGEAVSPAQNRCIPGFLCVAREWRPAGESTYGWAANHTRTHASLCAPVGSARYPQPDTRETTHCSAAIQLCAGAAADMTQQGATLQNYNNELVKCAHRPPAYVHISCVRIG